MANNRYMSNFNITRKRIIFIMGFLLLIVIINGISSAIIKNKITGILLKNESKYYTAQVGSSHFRLLRGSLILNNVSLIPTQIALDSLIRHDLKKQTLDSIALSSVKFKGIGLIHVLFNNKINISTLEINDLHIKSFQNDENKKTTKENKALNLDSIYINQLNGLEINKIKVNNFVYEVVDARSNEITFKNEPLSFVSNGFKLEEQDSNVFKLLPVKESFEIEKIELNMNVVKYNFSVENIAFNFKEKLISIKKLSIKPQISKRELAKSYPFTKDIFDVDIEEIKVYDFNLTKLLNKKGIFIDSISVSGVNAELYKDKNRPFNLNSYKALPHITLQQTKTPLHIAKVRVSKSTILIEEHTEKRDTIMVVSLGDVNASIKNITSIKALREAPMLFDLNATLMKKVPMKLHASFQLKSQTFSFNGSLGNAQLKLFDSALFPAIGLKVLNGNLNSMVFLAVANNNTSKGSMTMLYHDLEATVFKANTFETNKLLSWSVNSVIKKSNPKKNRKTRIAVMEFERDTYKGLGNYMWKTLLSGITNSIAPGGKQVKFSKK